MKRNRSRRQRWITAVLGIVGAAAALTAAILLAQRLETALDRSPEGAGLALSRESAEAADQRLAAGGAAADEPASAVIYYNGETYVYNEDLSTLLILGIDDPVLTEYESARNASQADFILAAVFDPATETCTLIQINRDTMSDVPVLDTFGNYIGLETQQLALAHTYGNGLEMSAENTVYAVSRFLYGVVIDNYFSLTMDAIPILNDLAGGVTVTVEDDFSALDPTLVRGEQVKLDSGNVENFVRARSAIRDDPTNINRMARQRQYMTGLFEALREKARGDSAAFALEAYGALSGSLVTDCGLEELTDYAQRLSDYTLSAIITPEGESVRGEDYMEFYVDEQALQQLVLDTFYIRQPQAAE